jgi:glutamate formiminotransferase / 5-formyltetrahydrofolate cyclo-ligase
MLECVVNVSEGRDRRALDALAAATGDALLDLHVDEHHHRSVFTMAGAGVQEAVARLASRVLEMLDLATHGGAHPRRGTLDVVPFVPLRPDGAPLHVDESLDEAIEARDRFARWAGEELDLPCFLYGPERSLPEVRRDAFVRLDPDTGPATPHPRAGACAVGARHALVAYNVWLETPDVSHARAIADAVRSDSVRALGIALGRATQVSCNLVDPERYGPGALYDAVRALATDRGVQVTRAELVGLVPAAVLSAAPSERWAELDLAPERTIEARLSAAPN